ncbi:hyaluronate lyase [Glycomyces sambucus]|uniref:Hyaluronate lyase n=1 Tax=Glycomyces sambucus TaxID=380244 RepID=A0A1G9F545_9ACTN|nr:polysaccharide lyase 8 family protein [Glycomyces sambucus]SDK83484.1 hyaluronate lyase [Glycomyces sambucus]
MPPRRPTATRRRLIGGGLALSGAALLAASGDDRPATAPDGDRAAERAATGLLDRARDLLVGGAFDPADADYAQALGALDRAATRFWDDMDRGEDRTALWSDIAPPSDPAGFNTAYSRILRTALAWATPGTGQHGDDAIAAGLADALALLHREGYHADAERTGNWYWWEIGSPAALMRACVLLGDHVPRDDLARYLATVDRWCPGASVRPTAPDEAETGANRADKAAILTLRGILGRSPAKLEQARDDLTGAAGDGAGNVFALVTAGDGFHDDGSYLQHGCVPSTGSYGMVLLGSVALVTALLHGTRWAVPAADVERLYTTVEQSFAPFNEDGRFMDCLRGRSIARPYHRDDTTAAALLTAVTALAEHASEPHRARLRSLAKGWLERTGPAAYFGAGDVGGIRRAKAVLAGDDPAAARPELTRVYPAMDRMLVRRADWSLALSMSSNRIAAYETGSGENLRGWYTGDGMSYLYLTADPDQYGDEFWPTANPYRYAGVTADTRERGPEGEDDRLTAPRPANDVAGGATLLDRYAVAAMDLVAEGSSLRAKKAWFVAGDAVIALGAGITATDGRAVVTAVEQRNLHEDGDNRLLVDDTERALEAGLSDRLVNARWAHLDGVGGYVFPGGADGLLARRETRRGSWNDIEQGPTTGGGDTTVHSRRYLSLWFNHDASPADATYAYALLPTATAEATRDWAAARPVTVLSNTTAVQAVGDEGLGLVAAHFWEPGDAGGLACDAPASVLAVRDGDEVHVAVADSGRTTDTAVVELPWAVAGVLQADETVVLEADRPARLVVRLRGTGGRTQRAVLAAV